VVRRESSAPHAPPANLPRRRRAERQRVEGAWRHLRITRAPAEGRGHGLAERSTTDRTRPQAL